MEKAFAAFASDSSSLSIGSWGSLEVTSSDDASSSGTSFIVSDSRSLSYEPSSESEGSWSFGVRPADSEAESVVLISRPSHLEATSVLLTAA